MSRVVDSLNCLSAFCAPADLHDLTQEELKSKTGLDQADVMVLFGGSPLAGADRLARAMDEKLAQTYIIVGGHGHTTETLREHILQVCPDLPETIESEAQMLDLYLQKMYGRQADCLETESTNCGNNITYLLDLLEEKQIPCRSMILCQDATMQRRMLAGLKKQAPDLFAISCPAYEVHIEESHGQPAFVESIHGMWTMERCISLLMGEIPRLSDTETGYGPSGKHFIAHVDLPDSVQNAFDCLSSVYGPAVRPADSRFAS